MPSVTVRRRWPDGDSLTVQVEVGHSFPDELAEAKAVALEAFAEAHGVVIAAVDEEAADG